MPFSDYCGLVKPDTAIGAEFWNTGNVNLYQDSTEVPCVPYDNEKMVGKWAATDKACSDGKAWTCRDVSGPDWCNVHEPGSTFGFMVWKLESGVASPTEPSELHHGKH